MNQILRGEVGGGKVEEAEELLRDGLIEGGGEGGVRRYNTGGREEGEGGREEGRERGGEEEGKSVLRLDFP